MGNMTFEEFKETIVADIKEFLPDRYENADISIQTVMKNNDVKLDAITIRLVDNNITPTIYLNSFYEQYQNGRSMENIMMELAEIQTSNEMSETMDISSITNFDQAKERIAARLVNLENNSEVLANRPYTEVGEDLAVTYCILVTDMPGQENSGMASVPITNDMMENYGVTVEVLHAAAMENMDTLTPATFRSINEVLAGMMLPKMIEECDGDREQAQAMLDSMIPPVNNMMYVLSNEQNINGAAELLNEGVMDRIAQEVGSDFYILPSSVHETLIVPKTTDMELRDLEAMVVEVNDTQVSQQDRLSDHVYAYDYDNHELYRADHEAEHQQAKEAGQEKAVAEMYDDNQPNLEADKIETSRATQDKPQRTDKVQDKDRSSVKAKLQAKQKEVAENAKTEKAAPEKAARSKGTELE